MNTFKNLYLVRHGKSSWANQETSDIDRPLKEKGMRDAYTMANKMLILNHRPDWIISSPALRALHTATIFARSLNLNYQIISILDDMYLTDKKTILQIIKSCDDQYKSIMLFGHNPTFTDLSNHFGGDFMDEMSTTGIAGFKFESQYWSKIDGIKPVEFFYDFPNNH